MREKFPSSGRAVRIVPLMGLFIVGLLVNPVLSGPLLQKALDGPWSEVDEIVFTVRAVGGDGHWYANFGHRSNNENQMNYGRDGGRLCRMNLRTGKIVDLLNDPGGGVRDPQVHYDGEKILFSYRKSGSRYYHLYEIQIDGTGLRQLTDDSFDDIEALYLPDGDILFCSSRCNRFVQCWYTQVAIRYRCDAEGKNIRVVSSNIEQDNTPWMLPDGRVLYMRWEYIDRSRVKYHHLWTSNPDGTAEMIYYGNQHPGTVMLDAKPIPGTGKVVSIFSPGHGRKEHAGALTVVDPEAGPDALDHAKKIGRSDNYRDPYPVSESLFLVAEESRLFLVDAKGQTEVVYSQPQDEADYWVHEPRPIRARPREHIIPSRVDPHRATGRLILTDITHGRNMKGIEPGEIKKLLVMEALPKPVNHSGTMEPISLDGTFTLPRILGTVPVEPDGSASMEVPALRSLFFVALDENDMSVKRMQSFVTVMPGETTSCVGCHDRRTETTRSLPNMTMALARGPSRIEPIDGVPEVFDFPRDIQPILDRHCLKCHDYDERPDGDLPLVGAYGPWFSHSYYALMSRGHVSHGRDSRGDYAPRAIGSSASPLMRLIDGTHYEAKLTSNEHKMIRLWIESGAPYAGTYAALGTGMINARPPKNVMIERCGRCHPVDAKRDWNTARYQGDLQYNLTDPARSPILLAPLSRAAGGWALCKEAKYDGKRTPRDASPPPAANVFNSVEDPDYLKILRNIENAKSRLDKIKRFDMPDFRPGPHYTREMKRYGILPSSFESDVDPIDPYAIDRAYWKSFWYEP